MSSRVRLRVADGLFGLACVASVLAIWLWLTSLSFDIVSLGIRLRVNDPEKTSEWAFAFLALAWLIARSQTTRRLIALLMIRSIRIDDRLPAALLVLSVLTMGWLHASRAVGGSDEFGYVSQADVWLHGPLVAVQPPVDQIPWPKARETLTPLGYAFRDNGTGWAQVPLYSPGLPLILAGVKALFGHGAMFVVVPVMASVLVLITFLLGRRLGGSLSGLCGAWLVATSWPIIQFAHVTTSDLPVATAWAMCFWCAATEGIGWAAGSGFAAGLALLIRPNHLPAVGVFALWCLWRAWMARQSPDANQRRGECLAAWGAMSIGLGVTTAIQWHLYGSPVSSGYGPMSLMFSGSHLPINIANYATWLTETETPLVWLGVAALAIPARLVWPQLPDRAVLGLLAAVVLVLWIEYCAYLVFDSSYYLRFLLAAWPPLMIGVAQSLRLIVRRWPMTRLLAIAAALGVGIHGLTLARDYRIADKRWSEMRWADVADIVHSRTDQTSVIISGIHNGSIRYYGDRMTIRADQIEDEWLDRCVAWLASHGKHPYAALSEAERDEFRRRFGPSSALGRLTIRPMVEYHSLETVYIYDLLDAPATTDFVGMTKRDGSAPLPVANPITMFLR